MRGLNTAAEKDPNITEPRGNIICIEDIRENQGETRDRALIMRMNTLDRSLHMPARAPVRNPMCFGVTPSPLGLMSALTSNRQPAWDFEMPGLVSFGSRSLISPSLS